MSQSRGDYEPQDRLPGEAQQGPQARFEMPVIGHDGTVAPIPAGHVPAQPGAAGAPGQEVARVGGAPTDRSLVCLFGDVKREGRWIVAERTRSVTVFGDTVLDLREASLEKAQVVVRAIVAFGDLKVIVPPGLDVRVTGGLVFGDQKVQRRTDPAPDSPRVNVEVYGAFGDVKVLELDPGEVEPKWYDRFRKL